MRLLYWGSALLAAGAGALALLYWWQPRANRSLPAPPGQEPPFYDGFVSGELETWDLLNHVHGAADPAPALGSVRTHLLTSFDGKDPTYQHVLGER